MYTEQREIEMTIETGSIIQHFFEQYAEVGRPIEVSFRDLVPQMALSDRFTHLIHPYPAKLLPNIPYFLLATERFCPKKGVVLDPFCGTGTVLLEAALSGRNALGVDSNPIARLISTVKPTAINAKQLQRELERIVKRAKDNNDTEIPDFPNRDYWFSAHVQRQISSLLASIRNIREQTVRNFFLVCMSNIIKKVSYADPRIYVPVKLNPERFTDKPDIYQKIRIKIDQLRDIDVYESFRKVATENITRIGTLINTEAVKVDAKVIASDARHITTDLQAKGLLPDESVDMVLTSPPYAGAQKYIRSSRLSLNWFGYGAADNIRDLEQASIGREGILKKNLVVEPTNIKEADSLIQKISAVDKTRACIVSTYLNEMREALTESVRVLKKGGYMILVVGPNKVCKYNFDTPSYLSDILQTLDMKKELELVDKIKSYGLMMKRNATADRIIVEKILFFRK